MRKIVDFSILDRLAKEHLNRVNSKLKTPKKHSVEIYKENSINFRLRKFAQNEDPKHKLFYNFIESNLEDIITEQPAELLTLHHDIESEWLKVDCSLTNLKKIKSKLLDEVFRYDLFRDGEVDSSSNIQWFQSINLKACPYCNRNWVSFVKNNLGKNKLYFDIDHYFPKYDYPWFALSFYNLIPSCTICNQRIKGINPLEITKHLHPYIDDFDEIVKFNVRVGDLDVFFDPNINIELEIIARPPRTNSDKDVLRAKEHYHFFNLKNLYDVHLDYVRELLQKRIIYSQKFVDQLKIDYEDIFHSPDEISRVLFGNYVLPEQIHERPLAKLTKDLTEGLL